jgi:hypothetical protein
MTLENYDWDRLAGLYPTDFIEKMKDDPCWKGYAMLGKKKKGGRQVPNCVKIDSKYSEDETADFGPERIKKYLKRNSEDHKEGDVATAEMTPNYLPKEPIPGGGDLKNPQMSEHKLRMPRMEEIKKAAKKDGHLAMMASANQGNDYHEDDYDAFHSSEPNAAMIITQLRVIREKADIMLGMLYPDDNLEPWCATKIANAGVAMASVADYLRFGGET